MGRRGFPRRAAAPVTVKLEGRPVQVRAWKYEVKGVSGATVPVYLLDCDLPRIRNGQETDALSVWGDSWYRLCQETVLGIGGCGCCVPSTTTASRAST